MNNITITVLLLLAFLCWDAVLGLIILMDKSAMSYFFFSIITAFVIIILSTVIAISIDKKSK